MRNLLWFVLVFVLFLSACSSSRVQEESDAVDALTYYAEDAGKADLDPMVKKSRITDLGANVNKFRAHNKKDPIPLEDFTNGKWVEHYKNDYYGGK